MKRKATTHWTERSVEDFSYRIAADFVSQLEDKMESLPMTQAELAKKLRVSKGRVSQIINNPGNLTLEKIITYARALGLKVAILAYDDGDAANEKGPINSDVFRICWENAGRPHNFRHLVAANVATVTRHDLHFDWGYGSDVQFVDTDKFTYRVTSRPEPGKLTSAVGVGGTCVATSSANIPGGGAITLSTLGGGSGSNININVGAFGGTTIEDFNGVPHRIECSFEPGHRD
jgi:transcriptional regulator with XRE-family HTH domain